MIQVARAERRFKIVRIPYRHVLTAFMESQVDGNYCLALQKFSGLPSGFSVVGVWENFAADSFDFKVCHPSFEQVPEGEEVPRIESSLEHHQYLISLDRSFTDIIKAKMRHLNDKV